MHTTNIVIADILFAIVAAREQVVSASRAVGIPEDCDCVFVVLSTMMASLILGYLQINRFVVLYDTLFADEIAHTSVNPDQTVHVGIVR